ncbi:hypothetical protein EHJ12_20400 [Cronobacter sakazakii]|nr:hypothetical protein [Cronobacter sakazakii]
MFINQAMMVVPQSFCLENERSEFFFKITSCQLRRTPYNAPPLTRHNGKRAGPSGRRKRK